MQPLYQLPLLVTAFSNPPATPLRTNLQTSTPLLPPITGGSAAADKTKHDQAATTELRAPYYSSGGGAGFAVFCFLLGFVLLCFGGCYISPLCTGSINERKTLCSPQEIRALAVDHPAANKL